MIRTKLFLLLIGLSFSTFLSAQQNNVRFKRITINNGLSLSSVYCIFQDSKGFMWFGTEDGLNRYDGKNFTIYRSDPENPNSISYKWIEQIFEDSLGNLWFGSRGGLTQFNPVSEIFTQFRGVGPNQQLRNDTITHLFEDAKQQLWIGTMRGIHRLNLKNLEIEAIKGEFPHSRINCFLEEKNDNFWVGTNNGLFYYDMESNEFREKSILEEKYDLEVTSLDYQDNYLLVGTNQGLYSISQGIDYKDSLKHFLKGLHIESILLDSKKDLWVVTSKALFKRRKNSQLFNKAIKSFESTNSLSINTNKPILENKSGEIWFGTFGSGLYRILPEKRHKFHYKSNSADPQSLSENSINCIYEDRSGVIWIGTFGAGISIYDPQSHKFSIFKHNPLSDNSLASNFIWSVWEDHEGDVWIGTNDRGISRYNIERDSFIHYDFRKSVKYPYSAIRKVFEDRKKNIWIGTDGDGLIRFEPKNGNRVHYTHKSGDNNSISNNSVRVIFEDSEGIIWIGTKDGLNQFNPQTNTFKQFKHDENDPNSISHNFIYSVIFEDSKGLIWIGTYGGGLNVLDKQTGKFRSYRYSPDGDNGISDNIVFSVYEDKNGILWIGTNNKLNRYDPKSDRFTQFGTEEGLPNNVIYGALADENNKLWLSTNYGICRFSLNDFSVKNFDVHDGLQSNEFNGGAFHKGKSGKLYFGGVYGLNVIDPNQEFPEEAPYDVVLTMLEIHGQEVCVSPISSKDGSKVLYSSENDSYSFSKSIAFTEEIKLDYNHRFISLEFSSLSNFSPDKVNYAYRLKGLEDRWIYSGRRNYASYSNLSPGSYMFQVQAQNPNGKWSRQPKELIIEIFPPFYMTWWFILLEVILGSCLIIFVYIYLLNIKTNKILTEQNEKIKITNMQLKESEQNLKELVATKDKFFRIISHDLKNPFTSLLSISEMIHENYQLVEEKEKQTGIRKIHESVKHIFSLLENLLTWSRSQTGKIHFNPEEFDLSELISQTVRLYSASADKKEIQLKQTCSQNAIVKADRNMCSSILRNLINNAIKFSNPKTEIRINVEKSNAFLKVQVIDQGVGIEKENLDKLFRIDLKYKTTGTLGEKGTGLGLLLCKEFAETNGGKIWVESSPGKGSTFSFLVPVV